MTDARILTIPDPAIIMMVGLSGSGKSAFARRHFRTSEIVSTDTLRETLSDDMNDQKVSREAFNLAYQLIEQRARRRLRTVFDALSLNPKSRAEIRAIAAKANMAVVAIVMETPVDLCARRVVARNASRDTDQAVPDDLPFQQAGRMSVLTLDAEGYDAVIRVSPHDPISRVASVAARHAAPDFIADAFGAYDVIGDVHGCYDELVALLASAGYRIGAEQPNGLIPFDHPEGRKAIFAGDYVDRGPNSDKVLGLLAGGVASRSAFGVLGNHDEKFLRAMNGANVVRGHGLAATMEQIEALSPERQRTLTGILKQLPRQLRLPVPNNHPLENDGFITIAHAAVTDDTIDRDNTRADEVAIYGVTNGQKTPEGFPVRLDFAEGRLHPRTVIHGHTPVEAVTRKRRTICIDTACVFGGALTMLRCDSNTLLQQKRLG